MARPMSPEQWLKALRAEGVTDIVEMPGWRTNNRNHKGPFSDVRATMIHHTAGEGPGLPAYCFNGNAALPGPLCHDFLARSGRLYLVGNGRANHAGTVARNAHDAVVNERSHHPAPDASEPLDGNGMSYGLECENNGQPGRTWPAKQYDVAVRVQAARCRVHGWSADSVWAHKEATRRKPVDPRLDMNQFRRDVAERLAHPASWNPGDAEEPNPIEEDPMAGITKQDIFNAVWKTDAIAGPTDAADHKTNPTWQPQSILKDVQVRVRRMDATVKAQSAAITALAGQVGKNTDTATVVAAVQKAIADAVIRVDVDINSKES
ncbi:MULTISPECIES: N-acetylmuramoyl-L-alanine amidase [unclassified Streptomyces]|uniref:peptidoglycan recognition protein family protein n=1 Tax=unclassified Streptomyces TaxID=2593676 RepID=UPI0009A23959|nr:MULTISPECIES: N-acetylmuramoyl-L-alanine amidase [unclassified Streptomyces]ONI48620.1 N-acetylmuramoyl-L-alanine amidase [Streptomyces sp. IB2014 011-1]RDV48160.1 N-acetylmuramoyl-L-alanine amidase [Streptomyces sp. IB2014 011-12]